MEIDIAVLIGVIITAVLGLVNLFHNKRGRYISVVVAERTKWIEQIREHFANFVVLTNKMRAIEKNHKDFESTSREAYKIQTIIAFMLNPEEHRSIIDYSLTMLTNSSCGLTIEREHEQEFRNAHSGLEKCVVKMLKEEWEFVKKESERIL